MEPKSSPSQPGCHGPALYGSKEAAELPAQPAQPGAPAEAEGEDEDAGEAAEGPAGLAPCGGGL